MTGTKRQFALGRIIAISLLAGVTAAGSAAAPVNAIAQGPGSRYGPEAGNLTSGRTLPIILRSANLTAEQRNQVQAILAARRQNARGLIQELRQAQDDLTDKLLTAGPLQLADVQPQLERISQLRDRLVQSSAQATLDIRALLTPEQLTRAGQLKDKLRQFRAEIQQFLGPTP